MATNVPTIRLTRTIHAPVAEVFRAWTDSALIQRWLAPHPYEVRDARADARPGGRYLIAVAEAGGELHTTTGEYLEVVPNRRLVKTWFYDGPFGRDETPSLLTVEFRAIGADATELTITHEKLRDLEARTGVGAGWTLCLDKLEALFDATNTRHPTGEEGAGAR